MPLAVQQQNPYVDGMNLTGPILQTEFSNLISAVNSIDNDKVSAGANISITKTELGTATGSANAIRLKNNIPMYFQKSTNVDDHYIYEDVAGNNLLFTLGTAGKGFFFRDNTPTNILELNTDPANKYLNLYKSYKLRTYGTGGVKFWEIYHNDSDAYTTVSSGALSVSANPVYFATSIFGNAANTYDLGSVAVPWRNVYGQNAYTIVSDEREKRDIQPIDTNKSVALMRAIENVDYLWKDFDVEIQERDEDGALVKDEDGNIVTKTEHQTHHRRHSGWIAQQIKTVMDNLGIDSENFAGYIEDAETGKLAIRQGEFIPHLLAYAQDIDKRLQAIEAKL